MHIYITCDLAHPRSPNIPGRPISHFHHPFIMSYGVCSRRPTPIQLMNYANKLHQSTGPTDDLEREGTHGHSGYGGHNPRDQDTEYGSGTAGGVGFGNKTSSSDDTYDNSDTRFGSSTNADSYSGGTDYGSGTTAGAGFGNKSAGEGEYDNSDTRFGTHQDTSSYSGSTDYGSGTTGGAGYGNKSSGGDSSDKKSGM